MRDLPAINDRMFPANMRRAIVAFWVKYWVWFFLLLSSPLPSSRQALLDFVLQTT